MKHKLDLDTFMARIGEILPRSIDFIGIHEPVFSGNEWIYVKECLDTGWVSSIGRFVDRFEQKLSEYTGVKKAIAVVNGTAALHICLKLAGVVHNDEVLVPALTFVATANVVTYCGAIPHFVDSEERTLGIDPQKLSDYLSDIADIHKSGCFNKNTGHRIKAIIPMHTFGYPVDLDPLLEISKRFNIQLIEDAAESLGTYYKGRHTGNWGKISALSFNGNKVITTGGGGAILTNDESLASLAKHLTTTAKIPHKWAFNHDNIGYNYRLPNINAALGCAQLEQINYFLEKKRNLARYYEKAFKNMEGLRFFKEPVFARSNYWLNVLLLDEENTDARDDLLDTMNALGFMARPAWTLMPKLPMFENCPKMDLTVAESLGKRVINLPSGAGLR